MCPPFITPILLLSMGPGGSEKTDYKKINNLNALLFSSHRRVVPLSLPFTKLSHSLNHCMLMHRITVGASSAWNSLFSYRPEKKRNKCFVNIQHIRYKGAVWDLLQETGFYLDESVYFHFPAFSQSFNLHLADGTHVQMVDCRPASKTEDTENNEFNREAEQKNPVSNHIAIDPLHHSPIRWISSKVYNILEKIWGITFISFNLKWLKQHL